MILQERGNVDVLGIYKRKARETFIFIYDHRDLPTLFRAFCRYADDPTINFTWTDAAILAGRARQAANELKEARKRNGHR